MGRTIASYAAIIFFAGIVVSVGALMAGVPLVPTPQPTDPPEPSVTLPIMVAQQFTDTPTPTEAVQLTAPPTPSEKPRPPDTPIPTPTPAPTSTLTVVPSPTNTPSPSSTPTATESPTITPTNTPPPTPPPAIVTGDRVKLYQGPGTAYDVVRNLPHGSILNVVRRLIGNPDWIQVAVVDPNEITGGWVYTANGSVQLNVNLSEISQIREFGPKLYEPARYAQYAIDDLITFKWEDLGPLEENQHYSLILVRNDLPDEQACYHWQPPGPEETFRPEDYGCTPGAYHWGVGLATDLAEGKGDPIWRDDSFRDERNPIGIGMPYPDTPTDTSYPEGTGSLPPPP